MDTDNQQLRQRALPPLSFQACGTTYHMTTKWLISPDCRNTTPISVGWPNLRIISHIQPVFSRCAGSGAHLITAVVNSRHVTFGPVLTHTLSLSVDPHSVTVLLIEANCQAATNGYKIKTVKAQTCCTCKRTQELVIARAEVTHAERTHKAVLPALWRVTAQLIISDQMSASPQGCRWP